MLGAILGPTDAIAATAILRRLGVPRWIAIVLEGEALVNDATALVAYKIAVAAAVGEGLSTSDAGLEFLGVAAGGIAIGLLVGYLLAEIRKRLDDPATEATMSLFSGYAAFLPADQLGLSGVLATVACGLYLGYRTPEPQGPQTRLHTRTLWEFLTFRKRNARPGRSASSTAGPACAARSPSPRLSLFPSPPIRAPRSPAAASSSSFSSPSASPSSPSSSKA